MVDDVVTLAGRVVYFALWALVLVLAAFLVTTLMHVDHASSSVLTADERIARAIASPFQVLDGLHLRYGWR